MQRASEVAENLLVQCPACLEMAWAALPGWTSHVDFCLVGQRAPRLRLGPWGICNPQACPYISSLTVHTLSFSTVPGTGSNAPLVN